MRGAERSRPSFLKRSSAIAGSRGARIFSSNTLVGRMLGENIDREMLGSAAMSGALADIRAEVAAWQAQHAADAPAGQPDYRGCR